MEAAISEQPAASGTTRRAALDSLTNRQRITGEQAAARTKLVRRLRVALPVFALVLIVALLANTRRGDTDDVFLEEFANLEARPDELRMANPKFAGVDNNGRPYEVTAEAALQAPNADDVVELVKPRATTKGSDTDTTVTAEKGVFQSQGNLLTLREGVTLRHAIGGATYVLRTDEAEVALGDETVRSTAGVEGDSESGTLRADRMQAFNGEGRVVFEGNVSMRLFPAKLDAGAPDEAIDAPEEGIQ